MKDAYYFPHDSNAIQDPKMMTLISECGLMGIGMFWIIIEILHQQPDGKITEDEYKRYLKFYYKCDDRGAAYIEKIEQVLSSSGLLLNKDGFVYSDRVIKNKNLRNEISQKRSIAGKKSAESRLKSTNAQQVSASVEQGKERKGKENKGNIVIGSSRPTQLEANKYFQELGKNQEAEKFFDYFESNGWKVGGKTAMKDWKAAARNWCRRLKEEVKRPEIKPFVPPKDDGIRLTAEQTKALIAKAMPRNMVNA